MARTTDTYHPRQEDGTMATRIRFERGVAGQVAAHLLSDDGGHCLVWCMTPGGTPMFQLSPDSRHASRVVDAPACDSFAQFKAFVTERFGDDQTGHIATEPGKPCKACAVIGRLTWLEDDGSCRRADVHR